jgi:hypothetical protein
VVVVVAHEMAVQLEQEELLLAGQDYRVLMVRLAQITMEEMVAPVQMAEQEEMAQAVEMVLPEMLPAAAVAVATELKASFQIPHEMVAMALTDVSLSVIFYLR